MSDTEIYSRERHLKDALARLQRRYHEEAQPIIDALVKIEMDKRPAPFVGQDGRLYEYIGPWPSDVRKSNWFCVVRHS